MTKIQYIPKSFYHYLMIRVYDGLVRSMVSTLTDDMDDKYIFKYHILTFVWNVGCVFGVIAPVTTVLWNVIAPLLHVGKTTYVQILILYGSYIAISILVIILIIVPTPMKSDNLELYKRYCNEVIVV